MAPPQVLNALPTSTHDDAAWAALSARDARFDGRLFVAVTSTGIYCRPVCRVRTPLRRNCRFYANAASAEQAGFRPCLRCRPELAPGLAFVDSSRTLATDAARMITRHVREATPLSMPSLAARLGVTDRHLRRIFQAEHGVAPVDYLTTQRLLLAKQLLTDTPLNVTQVAMASGFASLRRFNAAFAERYRLNPTALRRQSAASTETADTEGPDAVPQPDDAGITVRLGYRPPYDVDGVLRFFGRRCVNGLEAVDAAALSLQRTLSVVHDGRELSGWIDARFDATRHHVALRVSPSLVPALGTVVQRVRLGLDLDADPALVDPLLATLPGRATAGLRMPGAMQGFEAAVRVILGQQVTTTAARTLTERLVHSLGEPVQTPWRWLSHSFPTAQRLADASADEIGRLGIVRQRVKAIQGLAQAVASGQIDLHPAAPLAETLDALRALPGIGEWTVQLIALRALGWPDAFPATDLGVLEALKPWTGGERDARAAAALAEGWRPWRSYAVMHLWMNLEPQPEKTA
jgi:AraC family transcriptional regulator, regulatory protein of adaptative response / DNA-3-methyladenine glycosylase II